MVIYVDVELGLALMNFVFDYLLLWATVTATHLPASYWSIARGALVGTVHYAVATLSWWGLLPGYSWWHSPLATLLVPVLMLMATYGIHRRVWRATGYFLLMSAISAGGGYAVANALGAPNAPHHLAGTISACIILLVLAELGWGAISEQLRHKPLFIPVEVEFPTGKAQVLALYDTGNHLRDPLTSRQVIVVERAAISGILPAAVYQAPELLAAGRISALTQQLTVAGWAQRVHLVPFTSVGANNGLLVGLRPLQISIQIGHQQYAISNCLIGLCDHPLDTEGQYQALIGPEVITACRSRPGIPVSSILEKGAVSYAATRS